MVALAEILVYACFGVCVSICACDARGLVGGWEEEEGGINKDQFFLGGDSFSCYSYS